MNKPDYPHETEGSRLAAEGRKACNNLTDDEREELFRKGMAAIYASDIIELAKDLAAALKVMNRGQPMYCNYRENEILIQKAEDL